MAQCKHDAMLELQALLLEAPGELGEGLPEPIQVHLGDDQTVEVCHCVPDLLSGIVQEALQPADPRPIVLVAGDPNKLGGYSVL